MRGRGTVRGDTERSIQVHGDRGGDIERSIQVHGKLR